jgi:signal transduction histidine kinase
VIGGYLESLQDGKLKASPEIFETMQSEVQHMKHLVSDLRTLSLADAGELAIHCQPVAPGELVERATSAYQHQAEQQKIALRMEVEPGLPEISMDPERMEQVLGNLISNALRYTPEGGEICLTAKQVDGQVVLAVQDNGTGILPDVLPHIFERSYRADPSRSGNESGLGLAIAKAIVELHNGRIEAYSPGEGRGSIFSIFLPSGS